MKRMYTEKFIDYKKTLLGELVPVFQNPTPSEMKDLPLDVRGFYDPKKDNVYVTSYELLHNTILDILQKNGISLQNRKSELIYFVTDMRSNKVILSDYAASISKEEYSEFQNTKFFKRYFSGLSIDQPV